MRYLGFCIHKIFCLRWVVGGLVESWGLALVITLVRALVITAVRALVITLITFGADFIC